MIIENNYVLMQSTKQAFFIVVPNIDSTRKKLMKGFYRKSNFEFQSNKNQLQNKISAPILCPKSL